VLRPRVAAVPAVQQQKPAARCCSVTDGRTDAQRQTDGRTPYRYRDPVLHIMRAVPITKTPFCKSGSPLL